MSDTVKDFSDVDALVENDRIILLNPIQIKKLKQKDYIYECDECHVYHIKDEHRQEIEAMLNVKL